MRVEHVTYSFLGSIAAWMFHSPEPVQPSACHVPHRDGPVSFKGTVPDYTFGELYNMSDRFFTAFLSPNNARESRGINSTLFSEDVIGRVDVTRNFVGRELNTEYVFGLFSQIELDPSKFNLLGTPESFKFTHFVANQNIVSLSVIVNFDVKPLGVTTPAEILFWASFNEQGQITQYDATFRYLQWQLADLFDVGQKKFEIPDPVVFQSLLATQIASSICDTALSSCNGTNTQYRSKVECMDFLTKQIPFGAAHQLGFNTLLCRMAHAPMTVIQPGLHCPHIGPSGGSYCIDDRTYAGNVEQPLYELQPLVPYGYADKNETVAKQ